MFTLLLRVSYRTQSRARGDIFFNTALRLVVPMLAPLSVGAALFGLPLLF